MLTKYLDREAISAHVQMGLPWPAAGDRTAWQALSNHDSLINAAREVSSASYPLLTATQFLAFVRDGDRQRYEIPYFKRRQMLIRLAVGEAVEAKGVFLDQAIDGLWLLAEETSWVISAHNIDPHPGSPLREERPLPDKTDPVIDLFAAQTAATASLCCHILSERLDAVSPQIVNRMRQEVETRLIEPFLTRDDYWWMGVTRQDLNNWTPWILSNVLICLLYWVNDPERLALGLFRVIQMLDRYLGCLPDDGALDEGVAYWNMAGASVLDCLELLHHASGGWLDVFAEQKIRSIARFPLLAHISGPYFLNFADCDAQPRLDGERICSFARHLDDGELLALGQSVMALHPTYWPEDTPQMSRVLDRLFNQAPQSVQPAQPTRQGAVMLSSIGLWAGRRGRLCAAIKGGHNGENHNHNDLGSFIYCIDGQPMVIDVGNMTYTARTFSDERYSLFNTRSANHNIPLIGDFEQAPGKAHDARTLRMDVHGAQYSLEAAYPQEAGLIAFTREARLDEALTIADEITLVRPLPVTWVFMLRDEPKMSPCRCLAGNLRLCFPPGLSPQVKAIEVSDERLARSFPGRIYRLSLSADAGLRHSARFIMEVGTDA